MLPDFDPPSSSTAAGVSRSPSLLSRRTSSRRSLQMTLGVGTRWRRASNANLSSNDHARPSSPGPSLFSPRTPTTPQASTPTTPKSRQSCASTSSRSSGADSFYRTGSAYAASTPRLSSSTTRSTWELIEKEKHMQSIRKNRNFIFPLIEEKGPLSGGAELQGLSGYLGFTGFIGCADDEQDEPVVVVELRIDDRKKVPVTAEPTSAPSGGSSAAKERARYYSLLPGGTTAQQALSAFESPPERAGRRSVLRRKSAPRLLPLRRNSSSPRLGALAQTHAQAQGQGAAAQIPEHEAEERVPTAPASPALSTFSAFQRAANDIEFPMPPTSLPTPQLHHAAAMPAPLPVSASRRSSASAASGGSAESGASATSAASAPFALEIHAVDEEDDSVPLYPRPPPRKERRAPPGAFSSASSHASSGHSEHSTRSWDEKRLSESSSELPVPTTPTTPTGAWTQARLQRSPSHGRTPMFKRSMSFKPPAPLEPIEPVDVPEKPAEKADRRTSIKGKRRESAIYGQPAGLDAALDGRYEAEANPSLTDIISSE